MMSKRLIAVAIVSLASLAMLFFTQPRAAALTLTPEALDAIRQRCVTTQSELALLHSNDTLLRVNQGQRYESLMSRLMSPMNSRLVLNRYDAEGFVRITNQYEKKLTTFRSNWVAYEKRLQQTFSSNCRDDPEKFYNDIQTVRSLRKTLRQNVVDLNNSITSYRQALASFSDGIPESNQR